jgi:REP element-mobilizing transposase RayT
MPPQRIVQIIKSITARELFTLHPEVKTSLWGGEFWTKGYFISTVGRANSENAVRQYVKSQGIEKTYHALHTDQPVLFDH